MYTITHLRTITMVSLLSASALFTGCKKDNTSSLTNDDAADAMTYAVSSSSGGMASQVTTAANYSYAQGAYKTSGTQALTCGTAFDTTVLYSYSSTAVTASYSGMWDYELACTGPVPSSLTMTGTYTGDFDAPRLQSSNTGSRNWTLSGLDGTVNTPYSFSGTYTRTGTHTSKVRNHYTYTVDMTITVTALTVSKTTGQITGGSGTIAMTGTVSNGNVQSFTGSIVFHGGGAATLTVGSNTYDITL